MGMVDRLLAVGLVTRREDPDSRRHTIIGLGSIPARRSDHGRQLPPNLGRALSSADVRSRTGAEGNPMRATQADGSGSDAAQAPTPSLKSNATPNHRPRQPATPPLITR